MQLSLYQRVADPQKLRLWLGAFECTTKPALSWTLNGNAMAPQAVRDIESIRPPALVNQGIARAFSGVFEFSNLQPGTWHIVTVTANGSATSVNARTLVSNVPHILDSSFNLMLVSCFHSAEDKKGILGQTINRIAAIDKPDVTFFLGDQVYLDLPTLRDFPNNSQWLADNFEEKYKHNWVDANGLSSVFSLGASLAIPDDHEYWNNFPHPAPAVDNSWTQSGRKNWKEAAESEYLGFQQPFPLALGEPATFEVDPLFFFVADSRSSRDSNKRFFLDPVHQPKLTAWVNSVIQNKKIGVFVTGQSFLDPPRKLIGKIADFSLADHDDYKLIASELVRIVQSGQSLLLITGDVHYGRVTKIKSLQGGSAYEVISSPSSLVTTIGLDPIKKFLSGISGIFGKKNPWPRHSDASNVPDFLAKDIFGQNFSCNRIHPQKGNHFAMLSFKRFGTQVTVQTRYWQVHEDPEYQTIVKVNEFKL